MTKIIEQLLKPDMILVFDVDGVLAPYEWGSDNRHCMSDEEWNERLAKGEDIYSMIRTVKLFQDFINQKGIDKCYVCSKTGTADLKSKLKFVQRYGFPKKNIRFVAKKTDKIKFLDEIRDMLAIPEENIAIIDDTVKTLDGIAANRNYMTVHVSAFFA